MRTSYINRLAGFWLACLGALLTPTAALAQTGGQPANGDAPPSSQAQLTLDDLRTFTDVFNQVRRNYVEGADDKTLLESAIRGMLSELDPHSSYISGEAYRDIRDSSEGRYEGIGVDDDALGTDEPGLYVGGDLSTGQGTVADAIGSGRRAALLMPYGARPRTCRHSPRFFKVCEAQPALVPDDTHLGGDHRRPADEHPRHRQRNTHPRVCNADSLDVHAFTPHL